MYYALRTYLAPVGENAKDKIQQISIFAIPNSGYKIGLVLVPALKTVAHTCSRTYRYSPHFYTATN